MRAMTVAASIAALLLSATAGEAIAKQCRDGKGKFIKCPAAAAAAPARCKDAKGKFTKCGPAAAPAKH